MPAIATSPHGCTGVVQTDLHPVIMQALLNEHYLKAVAAVKADTGLDAFIAPAGLAWQRIYDGMNETEAGLPIGESVLNADFMYIWELVIAIMTSQCFCCSPHK